MNTPTVTVVIITKDSASVIEEAIDNAFQLSEDVVVVDTGSADNTPAVASRKGARVVPCHMEFFDYSTPRNVGLEVACGEFVFFLDTDERFDVGYVPIVRSAIERREYSIFRLLQQSFDPYGRLMGHSFYQARLMKTGIYKSQGLVYESFGPSGQFGMLEVMISQTALTDSMQAKYLARKSLVEREFCMLETAKPPGNPQEAIDSLVRLKSIYHGGIQNRGAVVDLAIRNHQLGLAMDHANEWLAIEMSIFLRLMGQHVAAKDALNKAREASSLSHQYFYELSLVADMLGEHMASLKAIKKAISLHYCSAYLKVEAYLLCRTGELDAALHSVAQAHRLLPSDPGMQLIFNQLAVMRGNKVSP